MKNSYADSFWKLVLTVFQLSVVIAGCEGASIAQTTNPPVLLSHLSSTRAVALESVTMRADPFPLTSSQQFGSDSRTRIAIFARNVELAPGEGVSSFASDVEDGSGRIYSLTVEHVSPLPNCEGVTMLVVRLSDDLGEVGDVLLRIRLRGVSSNRVRVAIGHFGGGPPDDTPGNQPPQVSITATPTSGISPLNVTFTSNASDPDGSVASRNWTFGDGHTSTQAAPTHLYQSAGSFTARLTVTDNAGASASASVVITVSAPPPPPNQPPRVNIAATPTSGISPLNVVFTSDAWDPDGYIVSRSWTFGDGHTSTQAGPTHLYQSAGSFTARLTVTDNAGASASASVVITVTAPPPPPANGTPLRVMSFNIEFGQGTDGVYNLDRTASWIANMNPDIIALCQVNRYAGDDQAQRLTTMVSQRTGRTWYFHWVEKYPGNFEGQMILSKFPFVSTSQLFLSYEFSVAQATVNVGGRNVNFFSVHLDWNYAAWREVQAIELNAWAATFAEPRILAGDFNAWPDQGSIATMNVHNYDAWLQAVGNGTATAYPDNPVGPGTRTRRGRIDYVFYSRGSTPYLELTSAQIPDSRDLSNTNVVRFTNTLDDRGVRPSEHNMVLANFLVR